MADQLLQLVDDGRRLGHKQLNVSDEWSCLGDKQAWLADKPSWLVDERRKPASVLMNDEPRSRRCHDLTVT